MRVVIVIVVIVVTGGKQSQLLALALGLSRSLTKTTYSKNQPNQFRFSCHMSNVIRQNKCENICYQILAIFLADQGVQ